MENIKEKLSLIYCSETAQIILNSKILVVGSGGIGCELVKSLSISGFQNVSIIDLDTIDVSNLNRQFLFRREHVDKPKSLVLKSQIEKQNQNIQIQAYLGKIQEERFTFQFYQSFDLIINALDNEEARKYVNQICFYFNKPLVDAGTNGYDMTCISIQKGQTLCYQCIERKKDQTFPVCTIRQKPEKMIHCIVWAKALFDGIYGSKESSNQNIIEDILEDLEQARQNSISNIDNKKFSKILIDKLFGQEPENLKKILNQGLESSNCDIEEKKSTEKFIKSINPIFFNDFQIEDQNLNDQVQENNQDTQLIVQSVKEQILNLISVINQIHSQKQNEIGQMYFNKDDELSVKFVTSASNLRAHNFNIQMESYFKIKEMAGKIVPAISSSNSLAANIQVFESIKLLKKQYQNLKGIFYNRINSSLRISSYKRNNEKKNSECQVCQDDSLSIYQLEIKDLALFTIQDFKEKVLIDEQINFTGNYLVIEFQGNIIYEFEQDQDEEEALISEKKLKKSFSDLKICNQSIFQANLSIKNEKNLETETNICFQIIQNSELNQFYELILFKKGIFTQKKEQNDQNLKQNIQKQDKKFYQEIEQLSSSDECEIQSQNDQNKLIMLPKKRSNDFRKIEDKQNQNLIELCDTEEAETNNTDELYQNKQKKQKL